MRVVIWNLYKNNGSVNRTDIKARISNKYLFFSISYYIPLVLWNFGITNKKKIIIKDIPVMIDPYFKDFGS